MSSTRLEGLVKRQEARPSHPHMRKEFLGRQMAQANLVKGHKSYASSTAAWKLYTRLRRLQRLDL